MSSVCRTLKMDPINIKRREYYHKTYQKNKKRINKLARIRYRKNKERYLTYCRKWHEKNPDYIKEYYSTHHKVSVTNKNRTPKMWTAQAVSSKMPIAPFCELCPTDDVRPAVLRHHPDYDYPTIFLSLCKSCHTCLHKDLMAQGISLQHLVEVPSIL